MKHLFHPTHLFTQFIFILKALIFPLFSSISVPIKFHVVRLQEKNNYFVIDLCLESTRISKLLQYHLNIFDVQYNTVLTHLEVY